MGDDILDDIKDGELEIKEENSLLRKIVVWIVVGLIVFWSVGRFYWWS